MRPAALVDHDQLRPSGLESRERSDLVSLSAQTLYTLTFESILNRNPTPIQHPESRCIE
jgi:hypothetical protein